MGSVKTPESRFVFEEDDSAPDQQCALENSLGGMFVYETMVSSMTLRLARALTTVNAGSKLGGGVLGGLVSEVSVEAGDEDATGSDSSNDSKDAPSASSRDGERDMVDGSGVVDTDRVAGWKTFSLSAESWRR